MANIFLDTNYFFDIVVRDKKKAKILKNHNLYLSPLSYHIYCYSERIKVPDKSLKPTLESFVFVNFTKDILNKSLDGPTSDLEDNIQLHSAVKAGCNYFLTTDKKLLNLRSFGKVKIVSRP